MADPSSNDGRFYHRLVITSARARWLADDLSQSAAGVTTAQAALLYFLAQSPGATQREAGDALAVTEASAGEMIAKLIGHGLVRRERAKSDGRAWSLDLTSEGQQAVLNLESRRSALNERLLAGESDETIQIVEAFLDRLSERIGRPD